MFDAGSFGEYQLLGVDGVCQDAPDTLILDLNVVIDVEHLAYGRDGSLPGERKQNLVELLAFAKKHVSVNYGPALAENCWPRTGPSPRRRSYAFKREALEKVLGWEEAELRYTAGSVDGQRVVPPVEVGPTDATVNTSILVLPGYAVLLKLWHIAHRGGYRSNPFAPYKELANWANDEVGYVPSYELQLGFDYFLSNQSTREYVQRLLKLGRPQLDVGTVWGAAWDLFYLHFLDLASGGQLEDGSNGSVALVTRDRGIVGLRDRCRLKYVIEAPDFAAGVTEDMRNQNRVEERYLGPLQALEERIRWSQASRLGQPPDTEKISKIVNDLEP